MLPKNLRPLYPYLKKYRRGFMVGTICVLLLNGIAVQFPQVILRALDYLKNGGRSAGQLSFYALLLVGIAVGKGIFQFLTRWIVIGISRDIEFDLRNDMFPHLERLSFPYYQRTRTGDIMARATNDLNAVRMLLGPAIMYSANTLVFTAGALFFMVKISPKLTLVRLPAPADREHRHAVFRAADSRALRAHPGDVLRHFRSRPGELFRRAGYSGLRAGSGRGRGIRGGQPRVHRRSLPLVRLMGMLWPTLELSLGMAVVIVLWLGRTRGLGASHQRGGVRRVHYVHVPADVAGHCARMGDQHLPARHGIAEADQ